MDSADNIENLLTLAEGYLDAALIVVSDCLKDNKRKRGDILIFPTLANANHGIELYLKGINWVLNVLAGSDRKIEGGHNIRMIYQMIRAKAGKINGTLSVNEFDQATSLLKQYIDELYTLTGTGEGNDNMDFSRYPLTKNYANHFYTNTNQNIVVDMENLTISFRQIALSLNNIANYLYYYVQNPINNGPMSFEQYMEEKNSQ